MLPDRAEGTGLLVVTLGEVWEEVDLDVVEADILLAAEPEPLPRPPLIMVTAGMEVEVGQVHGLAPGAGV